MAIATMDTTKNKLKVLMFPWLAHGHASPFLELSKRLIDKNFFVYFCSTPVILSSMKEKITQTQCLSIQLIDLHLPSSPELPPDHHTTKGLPHHLISKLKDALGMARPLFSAILEDVKPDLVIYDGFQPWTPEVCSLHKIPAIDFLTTGAAIICVGLYMVKYPERDLEEFPCRILTPRYHANPRNLSPSERKKIGESGYYKSVFRSSEIILIKSFAELEGEYFDYISVLAEKKLVPVGPLVENVDESGDECDEIMDWLDKKDNNSIVFVSFGSEGHLTKEEIEEIALGLELSNVNFLWVLRFPVGEKTTAEDALPQGFLERVGDRGKVWEDWAPQVKILAHPSIGGFITHCGWSSIMESMGMGVPIIGVPLHVDQPYIARLAEEAGVGIEVCRDSNSGGMKAEEIEKTIKKLMVGKDGEAVRAKAREISDVMKLKEEERMNVVVEELKKLCRKES